MADNFLLPGSQLIRNGDEINPGNEAATRVSQQAGKTGHAAHVNNGRPQEPPVFSGHSAAPPLYRRRPDSYCAKASGVTVEFSGRLRAVLLQVTKDEPLLQYAVLATATTACLYRYSRLSSIAIGVPAMQADGETAHSEKLSIIVTEIDGNTSFERLLLNVHETLTKQESYPLAIVLAEARKKGVQNRCPFFDVALVIPGLHSLPEARHDVTLTFNHQRRQGSLHAAFSTELYEPETIQRFCQHILRILQSGLENMGRLVSQLALLTEEEKHTLVTEWNTTAAVYPKDSCIHELFEEHAARAPNQTALACGTQRLTYRQLDECANQLAHYLRRMDIGPDTPIGIFLNRSIEQVVGVLGVLKAGAAYVPYDPAYPKDRLAAMFEDLQPKAVLTSEHLIDRLPAAAGTRRISLDGEAAKISQESTEKPPVQPAASHLCYIIFTSGSTGRAKPVAVHHGGWMNLLHWFVRQLEISAADRTLVMSSISFDITQRAMAMPLISGGELHLLNSDHFEPELILSTLDKAKITLMNCAPSTFYPLVEGPEAASGHARLRSLRWLILGGEGISASRLKSWAMAPDCKTQIINVYGAAECSDVSSYYILRDFDNYIKSSVPIGKPIYNTQIYLLDEHLQLVPLGVAGEICLAGDGVGKGYVNDAALTAAKFPSNPFASEPIDRIYRTGDLARYLPDGVLEFMGRVDNQVKIRGQRVELGEIESTLRQQPGVREAVVVQSAFSADFQRLIAYIVPRQATGDGEQQLLDELRAALSAKLPRHMVPNAFVVLDEMPLTPNGKIDRGSLPQVSAARGRTLSDPPRTETERTVAAIFAKVLKAEGVGSNDNFFNLGGHSLQVTQVLDSISAIFKVGFPARDFFKEPSIEAIAKYIDGTLKSEARLYVGAS